MKTRKIRRRLMTLPPITITLTRYREPDWLVNEALDSLAAQEGVDGEVIFLDQNWDENFACAVAARSNERLTFKCIPCTERCLSYARNEGLRLAAHDLVLFTEPDILADPNWARALVTELTKGAAIAGSRIVPKWRGPKPLLSKSHVVRDQYSLFDLGEETVGVSGPVRAIFGLRLSAALQPLRFDERLGRRDGRLLGGEETDLCERVRRDGGAIVYCGKSVAYHQILPERLSLKWIYNRLYYAGVSRRSRGGAPAPSRKPGLWDWLLLPFILPPYAAGYLTSRSGQS